MKKLLALILTVTLTLSIFLTTSCEKPDDTAISIGVMAGPTGMGMAKLMEDNKDSDEKYTFTVYSSKPTDFLPTLTNGTHDMLCLPTNVAANLAIKSPDRFTVLAINTLGALSLLTDDTVTVNSISDLEGKTVYASEPNSTTRPIINYILEQYNVNAEVIFADSHDELVQMVGKGGAPIAILPEPKASAAISANSKMSVDLNLTEAWNEVSDTPPVMGCIVVNNDFLNAHKSVVDRFLEEYEASLDFVSNPEYLDTAAEMIVAASIVPKLPLATKALKSLNDGGALDFIKGEKMKEALVAFYNAIGQALPSDSFYYE